MFSTSEALRCSHRLLVPPTDLTTRIAWLMDGGMVLVAGVLCSWGVAVRAGQRVWWFDQLMDNDTSFASGINSVRGWRAL